MSALAAGLLGFVGGYAKSKADTIDRQEDQMREDNLKALKAEADAKEYQQRRADKNNDAKELVEYKRGFDKDAITSVDLGDGRYSNTNNHTGETRIVGSRVRELARKPVTSTSKDEKVQMMSMLKNSGIDKDMAKAGAAQAALFHKRQLSEGKSQQEALAGTLQAVNQGIEKDGDKGFFSFLDSDKYNPSSFGSGKPQPSSQYYDMYSKMKVANPKATPQEIDAFLKKDYNVTKPQ